MNTLNFTLAALALITATLVLLLSFFRLNSIEKELINIKQGLKECANRTTLNKLDISTIDNRTKSNFKPKVKRGRPKKTKINPLHDPVAKPSKNGKQ